MLQAAALLTALWGVLGELLVAYQRRTGRGGDPRAAGDLLRDGRHVRGLACRPRCLRRVRGDLRRGLLCGAALAGAPFRARHRPRAGTAPGHPPARTGLLGRPCAAHRGRLPRRLRPGCALGRSARDRLRRGVRPRRLGLQDPPEALRRAPRPRGHHSPGRVDRGGGGGGFGGRARDPRYSSPPCSGSRSPPPCGGPTSTSSC